jgi:hypothetical protein
MKPRSESVFEGFCIGLDVALTSDRAKPRTLQESQMKFAAAVHESLSVYNQEALICLRDFICENLKGENPARRLESLWLSLKPTRVFLDRSDSKGQNTAYLSIFENVSEILDQEIASNRRS